MRWRWLGVAVGLLAAHEMYRRHLARQTTLFHASLGRLEYTVSGQGPALLVLHGSYGGFDQAHLLAEALGITGHRVVCVSRPGYLRSSLQPDIRSEVVLLTELLDALGIEQTAVLAFSAGGMVALRMAEIFPERVSRMVLLAPVSRALPLVFFPDWLHHSTGTLRDYLSAVGAALHTPRGRHLLGRFLLSQLLPDRRLAGTDRDFRHLTRFLPAQKLTVPTLVVHGTADLTVPILGSRQLGVRRPAELLEVRGGHHFFLASDEANGKIAEFLAAK